MRGGENRGAETPPRAGSGVGRTIADDEVVVSAGCGEAKNDIGPPRPVEIGEESSERKALLAVANLSAAAGSTATSASFSGRDSSSR